MKKLLHLSLYSTLSSSILLRVDEPMGKKSEEMLTPAPPIIPVIKVLHCKVTIPTWTRRHNASWACYIVAEGAWGQLIIPMLMRINVWYCSQFQLIWLWASYLAVHQVPLQHLCFPGRNMKEEIWWKPTWMAVCRRGGDEGRSWGIEGAPPPPTPTPSTSSGGEPLWGRRGPT